MPRRRILLLLAPLLGFAIYLLKRRDDSRAMWRFLDPRRLWDDGPSGIAGVIWLVTLALFIEFSLFRELHSFYFTLIYPFLACLLGYVLGAAARLAKASVVLDARRLTRLALACGTLVAFAMWQPWTVAASDVFPNEQKHLGKRNAYRFTPAPVLPRLSDLVRDLFWRDHRIRGDIDPGYRYYLWTKKRLFRTLPEIAAYVRAQTRPDETVAGASTMAPLVALAAGRRLAANEVDTNSKRFKSGLLSEQDYWNRICRDNVRLLISIRRSFFSKAYLERLPTVRKWFVHDRTFYDPELRYGARFPIHIYRRVDRPAPDGTVCRWEGPRARRRPR